MTQLRADAADMGDASTAGERNAPPTFHAARTCSSCGGERDRKGQRYCRSCFNAYHKAWRERRVARRLHAVVERRVLNVSRETGGAMVSVSHPVPAATPC